MELDIVYERQEQKEERKKRKERRKPECVREQAVWLPADQSVHI